MDRGQGSKGLALTVMRVMMKNNGFDKRDGQAPQAEQVTADFRVARAKYLTLRFNEGNGGLLGLVDGFNILFGKVGQQHEAANIVEETGGKCLLDDSSFLAFQLGDPAGRAGGGEAVHPQFFEGKWAVLDFLEFREDVDAEHE